MKVILTSDVKGSGKKGDVVEIENSRLSHVHSQNVWDIIVPLWVGFVVVCIGGFILYLGRLAIDS